MIKNVNSAFEKFMKDFVNLDPDVVVQARSSMQNLFDNISRFSNNDFFHLWNEINIQYGSFARKTKCRKLDDIDLMIGISADSATYNNSFVWDNISINASLSNKKQQDCSNLDGTLNSTKVLNVFKSKLESLNDYSRSEIHKNGQAITLYLKSREWNFDIVPCFQTEKDEDGRSYYLIPNGKGNWMKTDPTIDRNYVLEINKEKSGKVLNLVRLCKKWNKVKQVKTVPSYLFETIIVRYCENQSELDDNIDIRFQNFLEYLINGIYNQVLDIKGIQGNINSLSSAEKNNISEKAKNDYKKTIDAYKAKIEESNQQKAVNIWRDIFGEDFPEYGN